MDLAMLWASVITTIIYYLWNCPCATVPGFNPLAVIGSDYCCELGDVGIFEFAPYYLPNSCGIKMNYGVFDTAVSYPF